MSKTNYSRSNWGKIQILVSMFLSEIQLYLPIHWESTKTYKLVLWVAKHCKDRTEALLELWLLFLMPGTIQCGKRMCRGRGQVSTRQRKLGTYCSKSIFLVLPFRYRQESKQTLSKCIKSQNPKFEGMIVSPFSTGKEKKTDYPHSKPLHGYWTHW